MGTSSSDVMVRRAAAVLLAAAGVIHLILAPEYLAEAPLIGVLFLLSVPATVIPAVLVWRSGPWPVWLFGALVAAGMIAGFVASRTVGLFGYRSADWVEGIPALLTEAGLLVAIAVRSRRLARRSEPARA
jgi:hypothetical protein